MTYLLIYLIGALITLIMCVVHARRKKAVDVVSDAIVTLGFTLLWPIVWVVCLITGLITWGTK